MSDFDHRPRIEDMALTRRELLARMGNGMASLGLISLLGTQGLLGRAASAAPAPGGAATPLTPRAPHFTAKAKRVVFFFANGGPSHVDTFDPKPELTKRHGQPLPYSNLPTER